MTVQTAPTDFSDLRIVLNLAATGRVTPTSLLRDVLSQLTADDVSVLMPDDQASTETSDHIQTDVGDGTEAPDTAFSQLRERIRDLTQMPSNWDSYGGKRISEQAVRASFGFLKRYVSPEWTAPQVVPTSPGGVQLEWHQNSIDLEIEFSSSGEATVYCERVGGGSWERSLREADAEVRRIVREVAASGS